MTNFTTRMMIAAATLVVAAGAASAQTLKAEIPFTFRAGDTVMEAGSYQVSRISQQSGTPVFQLRDAARAILLMPVASGDANKSWVAKGKPVLSFECGPNHCSLAAIWTGAHADLAYLIRQVKMGKEEPVRVALIEIRPDKAD